MPVDGSSDFGRRIDVNYTAPDDKMLIGAYATKLSTEGHRYSLVVYNKYALALIPTGTAR